MFSGSEEGWRKPDAFRENLAGHMRRQEKEGTIPPGKYTDRRGLEKAHHHSRERFGAHTRRRHHRPKYYSANRPSRSSETSRKHQGVLDMTKRVPDVKRVAREAPHGTVHRSKKTGQLTGVTVEKASAFEVQPESDIVGSVYTEAIGGKEREVSATKPWGSASSETFAGLLQDKFESLRREHPTPRRVGKMSPPAEFKRERSLFAVAEGVVSMERVISNLLEGARKELDFLENYAPSVDATELEEDRWQLQILGLYVLIPQLEQLEAQAASLLNDSMRSMHEEIKQIDKKKAALEMLMLNIGQPNPGEDLVTSAMARMRGLGLAPDNFTKDSVDSESRQVIAQRLKTLKIDVPPETMKAWPDDMASALFVLEQAVADLEGEKQRKVAAMEKLAPGFRAKVSERIQDLYNSRAMYSACAVLADLAMVQGEGVLGKAKEDVVMSLSLTESVEPSIVAEVKTGHPVPHQILLRLAQASHDVDEILYGKVKDGNGNKVHVFGDSLGEFLNAANNRLATLKSSSRRDPEVDKTESEEAGLIRRIFNRFFGN